MNINKIKRLNEALDNLMVGLDKLNFKLGNADVEVNNSTGDDISAEDIKKVIEEKNPPIFFNDREGYHFMMDFSFELNGKKYWIESSYIAGDFSSFKLNIYKGLAESLNEDTTLDQIWKEIRNYPIIETSEGEIYLQPSEDGKFIQYGTVTNTGMIIDGEVEYDFDMSLDYNLQNVVDEIYEKYGYPLDESVERYLSVEPEGLVLYQGDKVEDRLDKFPYINGMTDDDVRKAAKKCFSNITDDIRVQWY